MESDEEEEEDINVDHRSGLGPKMLQFLTQALKPLSSRTRTLSLTSPTVPKIGDSPTNRHMKLPRAITISPDSHPRTSVTTSSDDNISSLRHDSLASLSNPSRNHTKLMKTRSIEPVSIKVPSEPTFRGRGRTRSIALNISRPILGSPLSTGAEKARTADSANDQQDTRQSILLARNWRFFSFLNKDGEQDTAGTNVPIADLGQHGTFESKKRLRKGEIYVLGYRYVNYAYTLTLIIHHFIDPWTIKQCAVSKVEVIIDPSSVLTPLFYDENSSMFGLS